LILKLPYAKLSINIRALFVILLASFYRNPYMGVRGRSFDSIVEKGERARERQRDKVRGDKEKGDKK
jgi:hypothetical protein